MEAERKAFGEKRKRTGSCARLTKKAEGAMRDRKPVLGIGMRGDLVSKVGEGLTGRRMEMRKEGERGAGLGRGAACKSYTKISE